MTRRAAPLALLAGLALAASSARAEEPPRWKMTAFPADLTPAFTYLEQRGITQLAGLRSAYGQIEAMFRPVPSEAAALLVPYGFNNIHVPWAMRGELVPEDQRRPGIQLRARYIDLGEHDSGRFVNSGIVVHEIAHGEYNFCKHRGGARGRNPRLARQHQLMHRLREHLVEHQGISRWSWPSFQANEMAAYYIETSVHEVMQRIESVFLVNRFRVRDIQSRADREALVDAEGEEVLLAPRDAPTIKALYEKPAWLVGGRKGDAWFDGEPIEDEIPEDWRQEFYRDILGLGLPETGDQVIAIARGLEGLWAAEQRRLIKQARDRRVERLEQEAAQAAAPDAGGIEVAAGAGAEAEDPVPSEAEAALLARVQAGTGWAGEPPSSPLRHLPLHGLARSR